MYYYYWLIAVFLYLGILTLYVILMKAVTTREKDEKSSDAIFFAIASIVTLSIMPLLRSNLYDRN